VFPRISWKISEGRDARSWCCRPLRNQTLTPSPRTFRQAEQAFAQDGEAKRGADAAGWASLAEQEIQRLDGALFTPEATQGQIDGSLSQLPYQCHQNGVASEGD